MNYALLLAFTILLAVVGCNPPPQVARPKKTMNYTLHICGDKTINSPSEADIHAAVLALDTKKGAAFIVLGISDSTYIQTSGDSKIGFDLEYQEADTQHHYRAKRDFTAAEIVKAPPIWTALPIGRRSQSGKASSGNLRRTLLCTFALHHCPLQTKWTSLRLGDNRFARISFLASIRTCRRLRVP